MNTLPIFDPIRTEFGIPRVSCGCDECRMNCRFMPGYLIPGDLDRLIPQGVAPLPWAEENLRASPGALVSAGGRVFRVPTLVPASREDHTCVNLAPDGRCVVHAAAPFGCAFFSCHDGGPASYDLSYKGLAAVMGAWQSRANLYCDTWLYLAGKGLITETPEDKRARMHDAVVPK